jgi:hypothetical protein
VGEALEVMFFDDATAAQTYELYGPKNYSTEEIAELVDREIFKKRRHINLPKPLLKPIAGVVNKALWWPIMSADEVEREFHDQVIDESAKTFKDLGITPGDIKDFTYHYLVRAHMTTVVLRLLADPSTARIPQLVILRPAASNGKGEEGREKVYPRPRRPVNLVGGRCERGRVECTYATQSIFFLNQGIRKKARGIASRFPCLCQGSQPLQDGGFTRCSTGLSVV